MRPTQNTILIIAPYWRHAGHVGHYRVDRYARWLSQAGYNVVIVRAGSTDAVETTSLGHELTIRDPLGLYRDTDAQTTTNTRRKPNRYRRLLAYLMFNPDPTIAWVRRVVTHPLVEEYGRGAACVLSSSPPESIHLASSRIAERLGTRLCIDLRDGWLDEPHKPLLQKYRLQRWREGRLERRVFAQADKIVVTSPVWNELLGTRLPFTRDKTVVVTNAYPLAGSDTSGVNPRDAVKDDAATARHRGRSGVAVTAENPDPLDPDETRAIHLVHAGRFTSSSNARAPRHLLGLLSSATEQYKSGGTITLLGDLNRDDLRDVDRWKTPLRRTGWALQCEPAVTRKQTLEILRQADGLLLLSVLRGVIPLKLFEYIHAKKPILAVTQKAGAVWRVADDVPQMFLADYRTPAESIAVVKRFLEACTTGEYEAHTPDVYSEDHLRNIFMNEVMTVCDAPVGPQH